MPEKEKGRKKQKQRMDDWSKLKARLWRADRQQDSNGKSICTTDFSWFLLNSLCFQGAPGNCSSVRKANLEVLIRASKLLIILFVLMCFPWEDEEEYLVWFSAYGIKMSVTPVRSSGAGRTIRSCSTPHQTTIPRYFGRNHDNWRDVKINMKCVV